MPPTGNEPAYTPPAPSGWEADFDEKELKIIRNAREYAEDAFGDVGHALKLTMAKMADKLDELS